MIKTQNKMAAVLEKEEEFARRIGAQVPAKWLNGGQKFPNDVFPGSSFAVSGG